MTPEEPGQPISRDEFQELIADLDVEAQPAGGRPAALASVEEEDEIAPEAAPRRDPAADLTPEDLVLKDEPKARPKRRQRNKRHGRAR